MSTRAKQTLLAGLVLIFVSAVLWAVVGSRGPSAPTELGRNVQKIEIDFDLNSLAEPGTESPEPFDPLVAQAVTEQGALDSFLADVRSVRPQIRSIDALLARRWQKLSPVWGTRLEPIIRYRNKPELDAMFALGRATIRDGLDLLPVDPDAARQRFESAFLLGRAMFEERLTFDELVAGLGLMGESAAAIRMHAVQTGDTAMATWIDEFDSKRIRLFNDVVSPVRAATWTFDPAKLARHAGDLFELARHSRERMWRVEATLAIGRFRFDAGEGRARDQRHAEEILAELSNDSDPAVAHAARLAAGLSVEEFRLIK